MAHCNTLARRLQLQNAKNFVKFNFSISLREFTQGRGGDHQEEKASKLAPAGLSWLKGYEKWRTNIMILGRRSYVGLYSNKEEAIRDLEKVQLQKEAIETEVSTIDDAAERKIVVRRMVLEAIDRNRSNDSKSMKSGHSNITWSESAGKWRVMARILGEKYTIGHFTDMKEAVAARDRVAAQKEIIGPQILNIPNVQERREFVSQRIGNIVGREVKTSKHMHVSWHEGPGKWEARLKIEGVNYNVGLYNNEDEAAADVAKILPHVPAIAEELAGIEEREKRQHFTLRIAPILGYKVMQPASQYRGVVRNGKGWMAQIGLQRVTFSRPSITGPHAEERASKEFEAINAQRDFVKEQLQGIEGRDAKRWWLYEYWAGLLGEKPPPRRRAPRWQAARRRPPVDQDLPRLLLLPKKKLT